jgi:hypothetical protein
MIPEGNKIGKLRRKWKKADVTLEPWNELHSTNCL